MYWDKGERWGHVGLLALLIDEVMYPAEVGGVGFEGDGAVSVEQFDESACEDTEVVVTLGGGDEWGVGRRGGVVEVVGDAIEPLSFPEAVMSE